jgi:hypothetical protein
MSKKRFTEGLESVFSPAAEETLLQDSPLLGRQKAASPEKADEGSKRSHGKDFSSDLEAFLADAFEESLDEQIEQREQRSAKTMSASAQVKKRHRRPLSGLDALIRSTVEPEDVQIQEAKGRRVTLTFDPRKLEKLKQIARLEKTYLRDIIDEIVAEFLDEYEQHKQGKR